MPSQTILKAFYRPIAHRGLHNRDKNLVENTAGAFAAALAKDYAIECDLQPARGGTPIVFHDDSLDRLVEGTGLVTEQPHASLKQLKYKSVDETIISFAELLELVNGRVPVMVELKSQWGTPDTNFLKQVAKIARDYKGPLVLKSFDPELMTGIRHYAPEIPRGIVARNYSGKGWWSDKLTPRQRFSLCHLLNCRPMKPNFVSYRIDDIPSGTTWAARKLFKLPLFVWTVRTTLQRAKAAQQADAQIFEGFEP